MVYTCYSLLTMFITYIPSLGKNLFTILPKADAAAVITTLFSLLDFNMSKKPNTVKGFTKLIDPCS